MSNTSISSTRRENPPIHQNNTDIVQELESIRALNASMRAYLSHLHVFKKNLLDMNENYKQLSKVNTEWIDTLNTIKQHKRN